MKISKQSILISIAIVLIVPTFIIYADNHKEANSKKSDEKLVAEAISDAIKVTTNFFEESGQNAEVNGAYKINRGDFVIHSPDLIISYRRYDGLTSGQHAGTIAGVTGNTDEYSQNSITGGHRIDKEFHTTDGMVYRLVLARVTPDWAIVLAVRIR